MSIRDSFVEHFGEENALRVEESALMHLAEGPAPHMNPHADDKWGDDPFTYLFLVCIGRDCFTRWRSWHKIDVTYEDILAWALEHADLYQYEGDFPDYLALLAGAYVPWINWEKAGHPEPEGAQEFRERNLAWANMTDVEFAAQNITDMENMRMLSEKGMRLLSEHDGEGTS